MTAAQILPTDALFDDCVKAAQERGWNLITNGRRTVISPVVPAGWQKIVVKIKCRSAARLETTKCAA